MSRPVEYLDLDDLQWLASTLLGDALQVRDIGLLGSAAARPQTTVRGEDAYPDIWTKAAALLQSLLKNHALVDGNKRLALAATLAFYGMNGVRLTLTNDEAYQLVMRVATGELDDVSSIASALERATAQRT